MSRFLLQAAGIDKREVGRIMQKLGQKGTTEEGLMDLYQYMQKHPHLKLDQIMNLSVASATFRKYLEDGLRKAAYRDKLAREGEHARTSLCLCRESCLHVNHGDAQTSDDTGLPVRGHLLQPAKLHVMPVGLDKAARDVPTLLMLCIAMWNLHKGKGAAH